MKRTLLLLLLSCIGLGGTYAWAGSAKEARPTVCRSPWM